MYKGIINLDFYTSFRVLGLQRTFICSMRQPPTGMEKAGGGLCPPLFCPLGTTI